MAMTAEQTWARGAKLVPVPITKVRGDLTLANHRLAPIVKGKVYCLHVETAEPVECAFSAASGCLVESELGLYAAVGQLISRDGEPGGEYAEYVVAAKISDDLTATRQACVLRMAWNASSIYVPTLVIAGAYDTWSFPEDREGLMRDLVHAPVKRSVLIPGATHFVLFEKNRFQFFEEVLNFLKQ